MAIIPILIVTIASLAVVQSASNNVSAVSCTISRYHEDDIKSAQRECGFLVLDSLEVPAGVTLDLSNLIEGIRIVFRGTTTFGYKEWEGPLISLAGRSADISGEDDHVIDGRGNLWWDGKGENSGKKKPKFFDVHLENSVIRNLNIRNSPLQTFDIVNSNELTLENILLDSKLGEAAGGLNTDGFHISDSVDVTIKGSTVYNQDDCVSIHSGERIEFNNNYCSGGYGISIGTVGESRTNNAVRDVVITDSRVENSTYGIRIKTVYGATGSVDDVTFNEITLTHIHGFGISIEGDYEHGRPTGRPTDGVPIRGLTVNGIHGAIDPDAVKIYVLVENASNWYFSNIDFDGGRDAERCEGIPENAGIACEFNPGP